MKTEKKAIRKVSVIVPNYNYARYLKKRLWSIVRQTYPIYELIILDDRSSDNSVQVIEREVKKIKAKYSELEVRFVKNEKNAGKAILQWRKGIEMARGDYVWIAEADDVSRRGFLAEAMRAFDDPEVVLSYTESMIINGRGIMVAPNFRWSRDRERTGHYRQSYVNEGRCEIEEIMAIRCTIPNVSAVVFRKDAIDLKWLDAAAKYAQVGDWYFYAKVLEGRKIAYSRRALNEFRVHGGSVTGESKKGRKHYEEVVGMHGYFCEKYGLDERMRSAMRKEADRIIDKYGIIE